MAHAGIVIPPRAQGRSWLRKWCTAVVIQCRTYKRSLACKSQAAHARKGQGDETTMTNELKKDAVYCVHFPEGEDLPVIKHSKNIPADWRACFRYEDDAKEFCEKIQASQAESYL